MALKLDLNKAFDRVEWDFLLAVLKKMGFGDIWCKWVEACITSYEMDFMVNGASIGTFLTASKGFHPSWLWQSIIQGRDLLLHGVRWQVHNGESILFWLNKWVPLNSDFHIQTAKGPFHSNMLVSYFINNGRWLLPKLKEVISLKEANLVYSIPLSQTKSPDKIIWHFESKGNYTVKSGYNLAVSLQQEHTSNRASSSTAPDKAFWRLLWSLKTIPKVKNFWWRACKNALATKDQLFRRRCAPSPLCPIYGSENETVEHLLLNCHWVKAVWFGCPLSLRVCRIDVSLAVWVQSILGDIHNVNEKRQAYEWIVNTAWFIWKERNAFVFKHRNRCPTRTIKAGADLNMSFASLHQFLDNAGDSNVRSSDSSSQKWHPPTSGYVKLNCDASFKDNSASSGILARDSNGNIICCTGDCFPATSPLMAELFAIRHACVLASSSQWQHVIIESDSKTAILLASTECVPPWSVAAIVEDIKSLSSHHAFLFKWCSRTCNMAAHNVAKLAFLASGFVFWDLNIPSQITSAARSDMI